MHYNTKYCLKITQTCIQAWLKFENVSMKLIKLFDIFKLKKFY